MPFFETIDNRLRRTEQDRVKYPELDVTDYDGIAKVDAISRMKGQELTAFGRAAEDVRVRLGFSPEEVGEIEREQRFGRRPPVIPTFAPPTPTGYSTTPPRFPGVSTGLGGYIGGFSGSGGPATESLASERLGFSPEEVGIRPTTREEEVRTGIARQRDARSRTRGYETLPAIEALEEFSPDRLRSGGAIQAQTERQVGITPAVQTAQLFDEFTGLPVRTVIRQGLQAFTDPAQAAKEQQELERQGGLGYGLEGSGLANVIKAIPGSEADIPGTGLSGYDITLGLLDIFADVGGVVGAAKAPAGALRAATGITARGVSEAATEAALRQADPTLATRAAGEVPRATGVPARPAISLGQTSDELLIMRIDGSVDDYARRGAEAVPSQTNVTGPRRLFHVEQTGYTSPSPMRNPQFVETVEEAVAINRADFGGNGRVFAVDVPDGVELTRVNGRLPLEGELSAERIAGEIRIGPRTDISLFGEKSLGPNDVVVFRNPNTGQISVHPRIGGGGPDDLEEAQRMAREAFQSEQNLRGLRQQELQAGRSQQAAQMAAREEAGRAAGLEGTELREFIEEGARTGSFQRTAGPVVEWTPAQRAAIDQMAVDAVSRGDVAPQVLKSVTEAVNRLQYGRGLRPFELDPTTSTGRMLREVLGDDVVESAARNMPTLQNKPGIRTPQTRVRPPTANQIRAGQTAVQPPALTTRSVAARQVIRANREAATEERAAAAAARRAETQAAREARRRATNAPRTPRRGPPSYAAPRIQNAPPRRTPASLSPQEPRIRAAIRRSRLARQQINEPPSFLRRFGQELLDFSGLPRAIKASFDISAPLRQGVLFVRRGEWWRAWEPMIQALRSDDFARGLQDELIGGPLTASRAARGDEAAKMAMDAAARADAAGLDLTSWGDDFVELTAREESFSTKWADRIPGMRASERAYATFLNKLRRDIFDNYADKVDEMLLNGTLSREQHAAELREMARWLNIGTGRADLPQRVASSDLMVAANRTFFSPRLNIARIQTVGEAVRVANPGSSLSRTMRIQIAEDIAGFVGAGVGALMLMHELGWIDVELDPRSSDFAKGVTQNGERLDAWGGFQQVARYTAQIITNQRKAADGDIEEFEGGRDEPLGRFIRSKLDPGIPGLVVDLITGHTFMGDDVVPTTPQETGKALADRFAPLSVVDIIEGARADGLLGAVRGAGSTIGLGYSQYMGYGDVLDQIAREYSGQTITIDRESITFPDVESVDELPKGLQDIVKMDQRAIDKLADLEPEDDGDLTRAQTSVLFDQHERNMATLEGALKTLLGGGVSGEARKDAIHEFKSDRWVASQAIFDGPLGDELEAGRGTQATIDILAEAYWSAPAPTVITELGDVRVDYDERDLIRQELLEQARPALEALGLTTDYITGSGVGTYRGLRFDDPKVREAVLEQEAFEEQLRETGLFDLKDAAWLAFRDQHEALSGDEYADYWQWRDAEVATLTRQYIDELGINPASARLEAEKEVASYRTISAFNEFYRTEFRHQWVVDNKDLALRALDEGWFSPDSAERKFLRDVE